MASDSVNMSLAAFLFKNGKRIPKNAQKQGKIAHFAEIVCLKQNVFGEKMLRIWYKKGKLLMTNQLLSRETKK